MRGGTSLPISRLRAGRARGGVATAGHGGMDLCRMRSDEHSRRGEGVFGSKSSSPLNGRLIYAARGVDVKTLRLFIFV